MRSLLFLALIAGAAVAQDDPKLAVAEPARDEIDSSTFISRAVFADGKLWVLADNGELSSITPGATTREFAQLPEPPVDICRTPTGVAALTCSGTRCSSWTLRRRIDGQWNTGEVIATRGEPLVALHCDGSSGLIVSTRRAIDVSKPQSALRFSRAISKDLVAATHVTKEYIFVGLNAGEWGGGLTRIDRRTGRVEVIEKKLGDGACKEPLDAACDPVNAIVDAPDKPGCVLVAIGLVHFLAHGRIVEVCGRDVRTVYSRTFKFNVENEEMANLENEEAFFGLAAAGTQRIAVGVAGLYRFSGAPQPLISPLPEFKVVDGICVNFDQSDVALVLTTINRRRSVSGNTPLLVLR